MVVQYGFGFIIEHLGIKKHLPFRQEDGEKSAIKGLSRGERLRKALVELGPTFIKLGQFLATRRDLLPKDIINSLQKLQDEVEPFGYLKAKEIIEKELGEPISKLFAEFNPIPLASASIGQVHRVRLLSGEEAVVKVLRPNIRPMVETDMEILFDLARHAEKRMEWGRHYKPTDIVDEFIQSLRREMDYRSEGRNAEKMRKKYTPGTIYVPQVYWDYTTIKVLTMEYVAGIRIDDREALLKAGIDPAQTAVNLAEVILKQILLDGFFHADPHPGNIRVSPDKGLIFYDFGMVGSLSHERREILISLVLGFVRKNSALVASTLKKMGIDFHNIKESQIKQDVEILRDKYYEVPFNEIRLGDALSDLFSLAYKYKVKAPAEYTLVVKTLINLEGTLSRLDPNFSLVEIAEPLGKKLLREKFSTNRLMKLFSEKMPEHLETLLNLPSSLVDALKVFGEGEARVKLEHQEIDKILNRVDKISNRLSFSIVLLSFSIIVAGLIIAAGTGGVLTLIPGLPLLEIGFILAGILLFWLVYSIFRSGSL